MFFKKESKMERWVNGYLEARDLRYPLAADRDREWLLMFAEMFNKEIVDITREDVIEFQKFVEGAYGHPIYRRDAITAVSNLIRYFRARGHRYLPQRLSYPLTRELH